MPAPDYKCKEDKAVKKLPFIQALIVLTTVGVLPLSAWSQTVRRSIEVTEITETPSIATETRESLAITYPEDRTIGIEFQGTGRLPDASGEAKVERKVGVTEIELELDEMKPATLFGGDIATYVLWVASPEGHLSNAGEVILNGNRSKLNASTPLETFGLFVTAEPHFLVETPSRLVVLENLGPKENVDSGMINVSRIPYKGFEGMYKYDIETLLRAEETSDTVRSEVMQAQIAVDLAQRAGADQLAPEEWAKAESALDRMLMAADVKSDAPDEIVPLAHEAIRLAYAAQQRAEEISG
jgi:hypothetical protein